MLGSLLGGDKYKAAERARWALEVLQAFVCRRLSPAWASARALNSPLVSTTSGLLPRTDHLRETQELLLCRVTLIHWKFGTVGPARV